MIVSSFGISEITLLYNEFVPNVLHNLLQTHQSTGEGVKSHDPGGRTALCCEHGLVIAAVNGAVRRSGST